MKDKKKTKKTTPVTTKNAYPSANRFSGKGFQGRTSTAGEARHRSLGNRNSKSG